MGLYTMKIRGTTTDRLADVIQSLQFIQKSGLLTVEREGPGNSSELGTITLQDGKIIDARVGQLRGADALRRLVTWTTCRFLFDPASVTQLSTSTSPPLPTGRYNDQVEVQTYKERQANEPSSTLITPYRSQHTQGIMPDFHHLGL